LEQLKKLPDGLKQLETAPAYHVRVSQAVQLLAQEVDARQSHYDDRQDR
jgi:hypothetical protein